MKSLPAAIVLLFTGFFPAPAHAEDVPYDAQIQYPIYRPVGDVGPDTVVQLEAPGRAWGIRRAARAVDAQVPGLVIRTTGSCATPGASVCVHVDVGSYSPEQALAISLGVSAGWAGLTVPYEGVRRVYFNRSVGVSRSYRGQVVLHELAHALGLGHHTSSGGATTVSTAPADPVTALSDQEVATLVEWFSVPRYYDPEAGQK